MKIESIRVLNGANVYSHQPVLVMRLNLEELKDKQSRETSGFNKLLLEALPNLREHHCNRGHIGGFVERLEEGTHFNHVVEHITGEMLAQAGLIKRDKKFCNGDEKDDSKAVIETTTVATTRYLVPVAAEMVGAIVAEKSFSFEEKITQAKEIAADTELGPSGQTIVEAAEQRGIPWTRENEYSLVQLGYGTNLHFVQAAVTDQTSSIAAQGFQKIIIKEDVDLRGRESGEVARLLCETVMREAPDRSCEIVLDEILAFENALWNMSENEVVVIFYDRLEPVLEILKKYQATPVSSFGSTKLAKIPAVQTS